MFKSSFSFKSNFSKDFTDNFSEKWDSTKENFSSNADKAKDSIFTAFENFKDYAFESAKAAKTHSKENINKLRVYLNSDAFENDIDQFIESIHFLNGDHSALIELNKIKMRKQRIRAKLIYIRNHVPKEVTKYAALGGLTGFKLAGPQGAVAGTKIGAGVIIAGFTIVAGEIIYNRFQSPVTITQLIEA